MKVKLLFGALMFTAISANAQLATINEDFESAVVSTPANYDNMVSGWVAKKNVDRNVYVDQATGNKYLQMYAGGSLTADIFAITPQIVAPDGTKQFTFTATPTGGMTLEVGLVDNPSNLAANTAVPASYQMIQSFTFSGTAPVTVAPFTIPQSSNQYIVFRFRNPAPTFPGSSHAALAIDNVQYNSAAVLATSDLTKSNSDIRFAVNAENTALQFVGKESPKSVEIYSALGTRVAAGTVDYNRFNISTLQTGVYYILIETKDGKIQKSKFIKK